jgi:hypothetical protein
MAAATWVLILSLVGGASGGTALTNVSGYTTKAACVAAGNQYKAANISGTQAFVCISGPDAP